MKTQLRILKGEEDGFPSESEDTDDPQPVLISRKASEIFDGEGNAVKKLPDEKWFNLVFDNS